MFSRMTRGIEQRMDCWEVMMMVVVVVVGRERKEGWVCGVWKMARIGGGMW